MVIKVELKEFLKLEKCKSFVNAFIKDKKVLKNTITPIQLGDVGVNPVKYLVFIEYEEN
jgi:hypothetical protein